MPILRQTVDLSAIAREVGEESRAEYPDRGFNFDIQEGMVAEADPQLLKLVFGNLIGNACKFSPTGGTIQVREQMQDGKSVYSVQDEGVGFDMEFVHKLFRPFERLVRDDQFPGTGIGLANVERIVQRHGGKVWAESQPGDGAMFFFTLA